jgi:hypothetical protein
MVTTINGNTIQMWGNTLKYTKEENAFIRQWASNNFEKFNYKDREDIKIISESGKELEFELKRNKKSIVIYL